MRGRVLLFVTLSLGGCSRLVDLDGLTGGEEPARDAAPPEPDAARDASPPEPDAMPDATSEMDAQPAAPDAQVDARMDEPDAGNGCPSREGLTPMVRVQAGSESFCVDQHEVTREQYRDFIESGPDLATLYTTTRCDAISDVRPANGYPPSPQDLELPVVYISYCGADAYCAYAGRTLCGAIKGGGVRFDLANSPTYGALARACAGEDSRVFAYGDTYGPTTCNGAQNGIGGPLPVATVPTCVTPDTQLFDLSGNVWEWVNACQEDADGIGDSCYAQGGAYNSGEAELRCDSTLHYGQRAAQQPTVGFRCCAHPD